MYVADRPRYRSVGWHDAPKTLLITLTGKDRPGVTSTVFATLARVRRRGARHRADRAAPRLVLGVLVTAAARLEGAARGAGAGRRGPRHGGRGGPRHRRQPAPRPEGRSHVTVLGSPLQARGGRRHRRPHRRHRRQHRPHRADGALPVTAIELHVSGADPDRLRVALAEEAAAQSVDVAVQPANLLRHGMRLIVMDVDSTLMQGEVIEMLAEHAGCLDEVARGHRAGDARRPRLRGVAARRAWRCSRGSTRAALDRVYDELELAPGARTMVRTLKRLGYRFAIVSGGFTQITDRLAADLGIDFAAANELEIVDGRLTGGIVGAGRRPGGQGRGAAPFRRRGRRGRAATVAIGDGANDLDMLSAAGLGIAFNAKPVVQQAADTRSTCPTWTRSCTCSASAARRSRPPTRSTGSTTPAPPLG